MKTSDSIAQLAEGLCTLQMAMTPIKKDSDNPFLHSKYADLTSHWQAIRSELAKNGLSVAQPTDYVDGYIVVETLLMHVSGEWISGSLKISPGREIAKSEGGGFAPSDDPQALGSYITYARRYGLAAMLGICAEGEDDDGETAMQRHKSSPKPATPKSSGDDRYWCPEHQTYWERREKDGKVWYSHKVTNPHGVPGGWCNMPEEPEEPLPEKGDSFKNMTELLTYYSKKHQLYVYDVARIAGFDVKEIQHQNPDHVQERVEAHLADELPF